MKKNKLINRLKLIYIIGLFFLHSCNNELYDGELNSNSTQISQGVEITEEIAKEVALNFYNKTYNPKIYLKNTNSKSIIFQSTKVKST